MLRPTTIVGVWLGLAVCASCTVKDVELGGTGTDDVIGTEDDTTDGVEACDAGPSTWTTPKRRLAPGYRAAELDLGEHAVPVFGAIEGTNWDVLGASGNWLSSSFGTIDELELIYYPGHPGGGFLAPAVSLAPRAADEGIPRFIELGPAGHREWVSTPKNFGAPSGTDAILLTNAGLDVVEPEVDGTFSVVASLPHPPAPPGVEARDIDLSFVANVWTPDLSERRIVAVWRFGRASEELGPLVVSVTRWDPDPGEFVLIDHRPVQGAFVVPTLWGVEHWNVAALQSAWIRVRDLDDNPKLVRVELLGQSATVDTLDVDIEGESPGALHYFAPVGDRYYATFFREQLSKLQLREIRDDGTPTKVLFEWPCSEASCYVSAIGDADGDLLPDILSKSADDELSLFSSATQQTQVVYRGPLDRAGGITDTNGDGRAELLAWIDADQSRLLIIERSDCP